MLQALVHFSLKYRGVVVALSRAIARLDRRIDAVRGDLERAAGAHETARGAQLFVAEASRAPRGAKRLVAVDWSSGESGEIEMKLDPAKPARAQLDAAFQRARRLKEGARIEIGGAAPG